MNELLTEKQEWEKLRNIIDRKTTNKYVPDNNWLEVINLFKEGFDNRYFNPLKRILKKLIKKERVI